MILSLYFNHFRDICIFSCIVPKICKPPMNILTHLITSCSVVWVQVAGEAGVHAPDTFHVQATQFMCQQPASDQRRHSGSDN